jgi:hypothetical protein
MAFHAISNMYPRCEWKMGDDTPRDIIKHSSTITFLQADGEELEYIRAKFDNIPMVKGNICKWQGAIAVFIFDNLPTAAFWKSEGIPY